MVTPTPLGQLGLSEELRSFIAEMPAEREPILRFVKVAAERTPAAARVIDVGAGDAPYRELFAHAEYVPMDWGASPHEGARQASIVASADAIPVADESFDVALLTQVLEHVREPAAVLAELHRLLIPGGRLLLTAPLAWELHEEPFDFYRYTRYGLEHLLEASGFQDVVVAPRNDSFSTIAQLMRNLSQTMGSSPQDGLDERRQSASTVLREFADQVAALGRLDVNWLLPLGYTAEATKGESTT